MLLPLYFSFYEYNLATVNLMFTVVTINFTIVNFTFYSMFFSEYNLATGSSTFTVVPVMEFD